MLNTMKEYFGNLYNYIDPQNYMVMTPLTGSPNVIVIARLAEGTLDTVYHPNGIVWSLEDFQAYWNNASPGSIYCFNDSYDDYAMIAIPTSQRDSFPFAQLVKSYDTTQDIRQHLQFIAYSMMPYISCIFFTYHSDNPETTSAKIVCPIGKVLPTDIQNEVMNAGMLISPSSFFQMPAYDVYANYQ